MTIFWTLSRKMSYEEHKKAEEDAVIRVMGEVLFEPSVTWWKDLITTSDFSEITKYLEEHHNEIKQFRLGGIDIPDPKPKLNEEQLERVLKEVDESVTKENKDEV